MTNLIRIFKFALTSFWRNIWLSIVTISIIVLAFLSVNFFILANTLVDTSIAAVEEKINITVNFKTAAQEQDIFALQDTLKEMPEVASTEYISKEDAFERMKEQYKETHHQTGRRYLSRPCIVSR